MGKLKKILGITLILVLIPLQAQAKLYKNFSKEASPIQKKAIQNQRRAYLNELQIKRLAAEAKYKKDVKKAKKNKLPLIIKFKNGGLKSFAGYDQFGKARYLQTRNLAAAQLSDVDKVWADPGVVGTGITLGVWDDGKALTSHQELTGRITVDDSIPGTLETGQHATWVTGVISSKGQFLNTSRGMASNANVRSYTFIGKTMPTIISEWQDAFDENNIILSNHSYGFSAGWNDNDTGTTSDDEWEGIVEIDQNEDVYFGYYDDNAENQDNFTFNNPTVTIVKAAGNDRGDFITTKPHFHSYDSSNSSDDHEKDGGEDGFDSIPGDSVPKNPIIVGATNADGLTMASFSGFGPADDGRIKPDISAKGTTFITTDYNANDSYSDGEGGHPNPVSGTSFAAPTVTGIIALLLEHQNNLDEGSSLLSSTLKALVLHTATDILNTGPDYQSGWGVINAKNAIDQMNLNEAITGNILEGELTNDETITFNIVISANTNAKATLVWTDPKGSPVLLVNDPSSLDPEDPMLVNDLDLRISSIPTPASISLPWILDKDNPGNDATKGDNTVDNIEQVILPTETIAVPYQVQITHKGSLSTAQKFSLIQEVTNIPSTINISVTTTNMRLGEALTLNAAILPAETSQFITWSIDEGEEFAGISSGNILVPTDNGKVILRASALGFENQFATININICSDIILTSIDISSTSNVKLLTTLALEANLDPESTCHQLSWEIIDGQEIASINSENTLVPSATGTIIIKASVEDSELIATQAITILHADPTNLTINLPTTNITTNDQALTLNATIAPPQALQCISWSLDTGDSANITGTDPFFLDPIDGGPVTIRARACSDNAITDTEIVTITVPPGSVEIDLPTNNLIIGSTMNLIASVLPAGASQELIWILDTGLNFADIILPDILEANDELTGNVTVKAIVKSTRGSINEIFATTNVNIILPRPESLEITITNTSITTSENLTLTAKVLPENASQAANWSITNGEEIATITGSGPFTLEPTGTGNVTLLAQAQGRSTISDTITITILDPLPPALSITKFTNGPNPFDPRNGTTIYIDLTRPSKVTLQLYGLNRKRLWTKNLGTITSAEVPWNGRNKYAQTLANGIYILFIIAEDSSGTKIIEKRKIGLLR